MNDLLLQALRILVVDDDADSRGFMIVALEGEGAEVREAGSVSEALALISEWKPDVLISDIRMPDDDGYGLLRQIQERSLSIPAIALTAFARNEDRAAALAAGFQCHLPKPVDLTELYAAIAVLADRSN